MTELTITLPLPPLACHPNSRPHWSARAKANAQQRLWGGLAAKSALGLAEPPRWAQATCQATFYVPKLGDADNRLASIKSALDSLADAGVIANDSGLTHLPVVQVVNGRRGGERKVVLVVRGGE